ncbi:unnamed protein product [Moneuplotes crassus]|uniref:NADP-dependent oxidoreductase domain-containing protein n=1 Tax=Euplotes crassus TaxID=5936 RepID=A0AAD1XQT3_EUPCR|nr:unnamed protein product [Moneuplotes crassus]
MEDTKVQIETHHTFNNGIKIPKIGLGSAYIDSSDEIYTAVAECGYRHIDTASFYFNEEIIGEALQKIYKETDIKRQDLFITSKIWGHQKKDVRGAVTESLEKLQTDYLDLYLIHWPVAYEEAEDGTKVLAKIPNHVVWAELEKLVDEGVIKSIGVSNFNVQSLLDMLAYCRIKPVCNQIELHPYLVQEELVKFMIDNEIVPIAFCPLIRGGNENMKGPKDVLELDLIQELATKYAKTPGQILLNWGLQRGHLIIPKSSKKSRLLENLDSNSFVLEKEDVDKLTALNCDWRICDSKNCDFLLNYNIFR